MHALAVYVHQIDPLALELWDGRGVTWYGLSYLAGFVVAFLLVRRVAKVGRSTLKPHQASDMVIAVAIGVMLGGRLGYVFFYRPELLWDFRNAAPWWGVLAIHEGGMASHGGMIGAILACYWFARKYQHRTAHVLDLAAFGTPIGLLFGRIANFVNGELYGRICSPNLPWAVKFPREIYEWSDARKLTLKPVVELLPNVQDADLTTIKQSLPEIVSRIQHGSVRFADALAPYLNPRHPSQIYEALLEGLVVFIVLAAVWTRPRRPLVVGSLFLVVYGVLRIFVECFREPDAHIGYRHILTRGQWLSVGLVVAGLVLLIVFVRRNVEPMGGWLWGKSGSAPAGKGK